MGEDSERTLAVHPVGSCAHPRPVIAISHRAAQHPGPGQRGTWLDAGEIGSPQTWMHPPAECRRTRLPAGPLDRIWTVVSLEWSVQSGPWLRVHGAEPAPCEGVAAGVGLADSWSAFGSKPPGRRTPEMAGGDCRRPQLRVQARLGPPLASPQRFHRRTACGVRGPGADWSCAAPGRHRFWRGAWSSASHAAASSSQRVHGTRLPGGGPTGTSRLVHAKSKEKGRPLKLVHWNRQQPRRRWSGRLSSPEAGAQSWLPWPRVGADSRCERECTRPSRRPPAP
mmetsp:Transcript_4429/g.13192  ORF Transcript_4429/g.13192 Transcript_4429/m.13192 type:complete len:281 (+) Transcript_4429:465-1307(+)